MKTIKTLIFTILSTSIIWVWYCFNFYYDYDVNSTTQHNETNIGNIVETDVINNNNSVLNKLLDLFKLSNQQWYNSGTSKAIYYAKMTVNMLLWLVSFIALVMLIYAFYMIFFLKEDSWITKAKQIIKWVSLALIIMWLSRFIISFLFWIQSNSATP